MKNKSRFGSAGDRPFGSGGPRVAPKSPPSPDLAAMLEQALGFHRAGLLAEAEQLYRKIIQSQSSHFDALHLLGVLHYQRGDLKHAIRQIDTALKKNANVAAAHNNRGLILKDLKRLDEALASHNRAIALDPNFVEAFYNRGRVLRELNRFDQALASYDSAIALRPGDPDAHNNRGNALKELKRLDEAVTAYDRAIALRPDHSEAHNNRGLALAELERYDEAIACYNRALGIQPDYANAFSNRGAALVGLKRFDEAMANYDRAIAIKPDCVEAYNGRGAVFAEFKRFDDALACHQQAIAIDPNCAAAYNDRGNALKELKRFDEALASYRQAITLKPDFAAAFNNRGLALADMKRYDDAIKDYDRAISLNPNYAEAFNNRGISLKQRRRLDQALADYDRAIQLKPSLAEAFNNRGIALNELHRFDEALAAYDQAIAIKPDLAEAFSNRGISLKQLKRFDEALANCDRAIAIKPDCVGAINNRGVILQELKRYEEAIACYDRALAIDPLFSDARHNRAHTLVKLHRRSEAMADFETAWQTDPNHDDFYHSYLESALAVCDWAKVASLTEDFHDRIFQGAAAISPFVAWGLDVDAASQYRCSQNSIAVTAPRIEQPMFDRDIVRDGRRRIAFLSPDFRLHAAGTSLVEVFERLDHDRFEIIGLSLNPDDGSATRARFVKAMDQFHDVQDMSDEEVARLIVKLRVDIAVEQTPFTENTRAGILAHRPAPVQVNMFHGGISTGSTFIDYALGDAIVLPFEDQRYFSEKIVQLPDNHFAHDSTQQISPATPSRTEAGLPAQGFVFCCFNNSWKLSPRIFDIWMRLLHQVEGSVLWLSDQNDLAKSNLRAETARRGIDLARVIFAPKLLKIEDHLARHRLADLFLDTLPANAQTTATDALWAGLPVLTCRGARFSERVAASLLHAIGVPELVTENLQEYEALALRLANDPERLQALRDKIAANRTTTPLFDTGHLCRHIEKAFDMMWDIWRNGESPRAFLVERIP
jgi:protein O-GlcNAc transferase